ncbi:MAG: VCBS repeat-containing protein [Planctomycetes bacterium]|nr:VCBS repeat-containing protein [Planctomycetota bacterium]
MFTTMFAAAVLLLPIATPAGPGPVESDHPLFTRTAEMANDGFGSELVRLGDLDGDGVRDLAVSAVGRGQVLLVSGADGHTLSVLGGPTGFGHGLVVADVDGDSVDDLVVAAPFAAVAAGEVRVHSGHDGSLLAVVAGRGAASHLGELLLSPGDVDGDGRDDLLVSDAGGVRLIDVLANRDLPVDEGLRAFGDTLLALRRQGLPARGLFVDDLDGDGRREPVLALPYSLDGMRGEVVVTRSSDGSTLQRLRSGREGDGFGWSLASTDDLDGDGHADLVIGAPSDDQGGRDAGAAYVVSGRSGTPLFAVRGTEPGEHLGNAVAALDDIDGDGVSDVLAGAQRDDGRGRLLAFPTPVRPRGGMELRPVLGDRNP